MINTALYAIFLVLLTTSCANLKEKTKNQTPKIQKKISKNLNCGSYFKNIVGPGKRRWKEVVSASHYDELSYLIRDINWTQQKRLTYFLKKNLWLRERALTHSVLKNLILYKKKYTPQKALEKAIYLTLKKLSKEVKTLEELRSFWSRMNIERYQGHRLLELLKSMPLIKILYTLNPHLETIVQTRLGPLKEINRINYHFKAIFSVLEVLASKKPHKHLSQVKSPYGFIKIIEKLFNQGYRHTDNEWKTLLKSPFAQKIQLKDFHLFSILHEFRELRSVNFKLVSYYAVKKIDPFTEKMKFSIEPLQ